MSLSQEIYTIFAACIDTPIGNMLAVCRKRILCRLRFVDNMEEEREKLQMSVKSPVIFKKTDILTLLEKELEAYFLGKISPFSTPISPLGSSFQKKVWEKLQNIPPGKTLSYREVAESVDSPKASRPVGSAAARNETAIVVPCHRMIRSNGDIGGYLGGSSRKEWLLAHEAKHAR